MNIKKKDRKKYERIFDFSKTIYGKTHNNSKIQFLLGLLDNFLSCNYSWKWKLMRSLHSSDYELKRII